MLRQIQRVGDFADRSIGFRALLHWRTRWRRA
jgi:hypothetical protein